MSFIVTEKEILELNSFSDKKNNNNFFPETKKNFRMRK